MSCPNCHSEKTRRGGRKTWIVYLMLIAAAVPAVLVLHLDAAIAGAIMIAVIVTAHMILGERVCLDCGHQWKG